MIIKLFYGQLEHDAANLTGLSLPSQIRYLSDIIHLMHSFEVDIRICHPENSDVHRGKAELNITLEG